MISRDNLIKQVNIAVNTKQSVPSRFYQRFGSSGDVLNAEWPRITTRASERIFEKRHDGLEVLMINAPIREWSYPNIMPIGHGYVGAVAAMDGHKLDVLDLNAERRVPVTEDYDNFDKWVEHEVEERLGKSRPDVIG